jgi:HEAT repeat protein
MEYLYGEEIAEALWAIVPTDVELYFVEFVLRYRRRLSGDETIKIEALAQPYLPKVARRMRRRGAERRARAIQTLGELGLQDYAEAVAKYLDDRSPLVAMSAARALADPELPGYTNAILSRMHRFTNWRSSFLSAMLAGIGTDAAPDLRAKYEDETASPGVRAIAAGALGQLNDFKSAAIAAKILEGKPDRDLAAESLRLLGRVGRAEDVELVRRLIQSEDAVVRGASAGALGKLGSSADSEILRETASSDPSHWVAITAARGLRELGGVKALRELATSSHARAPLALQVLAEVGS